MEGLCVGGGLIWKSRCGGVLRSNTGTLSLLLVCPVDSISPQLPWSSLTIRLASWSNGQVKVKVRRFAGVLAALNHHVPFGPVKGYSGRSTMPYIILHGHLHPDPVMPRTNYWGLSQLVA